MANYLGNGWHIAASSASHLVYLIIVSAELGLSAMTRACPILDDNFEAGPLAPTVSLIQVSANVLHRDHPHVGLFSAPATNDSQIGQGAHVDLKPKLTFSHVSDVGGMSATRTIRDVVGSRLISFAAVAADTLSWDSIEITFICIAATFVFILSCIFALSERAVDGGDFVQNSGRESYSSKASSSRAFRRPNEHHALDLSSVDHPVSSRLNTARSSCSSSSWSRLQTKPAPICGELVLRLCESWFAIPLSELDAATGDVPIVGLSGKRLLTATIRKENNSGEGTLYLSLKGGGATLGSIKCFSGGPMIIVDQEKARYGELRCAGQLCHALVCGSEEKLRVVYHAESNEMLLLSSIDGSTLAIASKLQASEIVPTQEDHLQVKVHMGMDPILALLCIIASMVFDVSS